MKPSPSPIPPTTPKKHCSHVEMAKDFQTRFWISIILTIPILLLTPTIQNWLQIQSLSFDSDLWVLLALGTTAFFYCGWPFLKGSFIEIRTRNPGMMTLIALSITIPYFYSSAVALGFSGDLIFWELTILSDIMLLVHFIQMHSISSASKSMHTLLKLLPQTVHLATDKNEIIDIPLQTIKKNDKIIIKPGERIPADGWVIGGETTVNEAMLTGEPNPVYKRVGFKVIAGSINNKGSITIEVEATSAHSYLSQLTKLVEDARLSHSQIQQFADRAAKILTITAISGAAISFIVWKIVINKDLAFSLERMVTVMVIACPDALVLAIPLVLAMSTSISATKGILIKNCQAFETAHKIQSVFFDKTGTLTEGRFGVTDIEVFRYGVNRDELIKYAASAELHSQHPVAKGIVQFSVETFNATMFADITGKGVSALVEGKNIKVVSQSYLHEHNIHIDAQYVNRLREDGRTIAYVLINNELYGAITLSDIIRAESRSAIKILKRMGIKTVMLTGDNRNVAKYVAEELHIDDYFAETQPLGKAIRIKELQNQGLLTAMTGNSFHDAPALAQADVGFAIGTGNDFATKTADIVLVHNNPLDVVKAIHISKITYKKMNQNLFWAISYNIVALPLAAGVLASWGILLSPTAAAIFMSVCTVIIALNSRHLRFNT